MSPHPPSRGRFSGGGFPSTADRWRATPSEPFGGIAASRWTSPQAWQSATHTNILNATNGVVGGKKRMRGESFSGASPAITPPSPPRTAHSSAGNSAARPPQAGREQIQASLPKGTVTSKQWSAYQNQIPPKSSSKQWSKTVNYQTFSQPQNSSHQNSNFPQPALHSKEAAIPSQPRNKGYEASSNTKSSIVSQQGQVIVLSDSDHEDKLVESPSHRVSKGLPQKRKARGSSAPASKKAKAAVPDRGSRTTQTPQGNGKGSHASRDIDSEKVAQVEAELASRLEAAQTLSNMLTMFSSPAPRARTVPPFLAEDPDSPTEYTAHDMRILYNRYGPDILRAKQASYDEFGRVDPLPGDDDWAFDDEWIQQWIPMKPGQEHIQNVRDREVLGGRWPDWLDEDGTVRYLTEVPLREIIGTIGNPGG